MRSFDRVIIITNGHSLTRKSQPTKRIRSPCDLELKKNAQRSFFLISRWKYDTNMVPENLIIISPFFPPSIFLSMWRGPIGLPIVANWVAKMKKNHMAFSFLIKHIYVFFKAQWSKDLGGVTLEIGALFVFIFLPDLEGSCTISTEILSLANACNLVFR